ncbi:MAG TPA: hypothetical protein VIM16_15805 [Mucilaginibacter sp.]
MEINTRATFQHNRLAFKLASSNDLDKINREVIESVKFRFLSKEIINGIPAGDENLLDSQQIQGGQEQLIYTNEEDLLENILALKPYKHHRHLRYLSQKHERTILKPRFVLEPFSFVFLLLGNNQYHLIWETLDTEEATYVWHIEKSLHELEKRIKQIDKLLRWLERGIHIRLEADGSSILLPGTKTLKVEPHSSTFDINISLSEIISLSDTISFLYFANTR